MSWIKHVLISIICVKSNLRGYRKIKQSHHQVLIRLFDETAVYKNSINRRQIMHRQSDINQAFRESVLRNSKGYQYLHTKDFVSALRRRGLHFTDSEANAWISREQTYFVDKTTDHSENRLWMMANMGRVL